MHSNSHHSCNHNHRELSKQQQQRQSHQPHRYNRTAFPSSTISPQSNSHRIPSLSTMSSSSSSFNDYASSPRDGSNPPSPDSALHKQCGVSPHISEQSAILLYQAFAGGHEKSPRCCTDDNLRRNDGESAMHFRMTTDSRPNKSARDEVDSDYVACSDFHGTSHGQDVSPKKHDQGDSSHDSRHRERRKENPTRQSQDGTEFSNADDHEEGSTPSHSPTSLTSISSLLSRHRTKIGTLFFSLASLWIYSKYKKKDSQNRRHGKDVNQDVIQKKIVDIYKLLLQMLSRLRSGDFRPPSKTKKLIHGSYRSQATPDASPWDQATIAPLSHLLAVAKSGNITKVMLRGSVLSYLHSIQSPSSSTGGGDPNQPKSLAQQRWSKTTLPSNNPNFLQEILSTLLNHGCHDITTLPESLLRRFLDGPALVIFPFAYLGALYWIMRRLQNHQLEDANGENDTTFTWNKNGPVKGCSSPQHTTTFDDVAGIDSALQELSEVVSYMRNPNAFHVVGASPPRGILLHGPPGSGKTLLARAIAGEAGRRAVGATGSLGHGATIDCFAVCSGSDFVETYVGRGAARVRALFRGVREEAWKNYERRRREFQRDIKKKKRNSMTSSGSVGSTVRDAWDSMQSLVTQRSSVVMADDGEEWSHHQTSRPMAIIFIDEIDALAKRRDSGSEFHSSLGGCDEREQTLNQLLTEMDGFATGSPAQPVHGPSGVIVIIVAATNRPEVLDPAILRAGRFDRHVQVPLPDASGREAILRVHARHIRYDPSSVDFRELAYGKQDHVAATGSLSPTHNFSGADLKNVVNEAALLAVRDGSTCVKQSHLVEAVRRVRNMVDSSHGGTHRTPAMHHWFVR